MLLINPKAGPKSLVTAEAEVLRCLGCCGMSVSLEFCSFLLQRSLREHIERLGSYFQWVQIHAVNFQGTLAKFHFMSEASFIFCRMQWHKHFSRMGWWLAWCRRFSSAHCNRLFYRRLPCFVFYQLADCFCKCEYTDRHSQRC